MLAEAPLGAAAQALAANSLQGAAVADSYVARALTRLGVLSELTAADRGRLPRADREACRLAYLLIGADLAAALLADDSHETRRKVRFAASRLYPEDPTDMANGPIEFTLEVGPEQAGRVGLAAMVDGSGVGSLAAIRTWDPDRGGDRFPLSDYFGFHRDVACVREALFAGEDDTNQTEAALDVSAKARMALRFAFSFSCDLAIRRFDRNGVPVLVEA
ncbi:MAG: hypothetical protein J0I42_09800 [Bosea sp.]|uniref:hypothetical protein n=1 Tax=Bosea sp. (in: a-proteobacteria) TaxID=1871050 RepID=UPI001AD40E84|nr:hypothetical protein [Bosea sp. (in: a-proteobacteria)]MBN9452232.1 hypothetical protein [Bosea sp. (in: a-proteobacteria)]